jgi:hypothetical protein
LLASPSRLLSRVRVSQALGRTSTSSRSQRPLRRRFRRRPRKQKCAPPAARCRVSSTDPCCRSKRRCVAKQPRAKRVLRCWSERWLHVRSTVSFACERARFA